MNWNERLAKRTTDMQRSTVREFLKLAAQPGMISFAGGLPAPELFPQEEVRVASDVVLTRYGGKALQYGETEGVPELREWVARMHNVSVENVLITSGAQQALDLIGRVLLDEGDQVAVENPTYLALLLAWKPLRVEYVPVVSDAEGLTTKEIPFASKLLYVIPNFQNPQGTTLSRDRRLALAEKAMREKLIVVEDDPYNELRYEGDALPSLFSLAGGASGPVIHVGTFSKVLAPGFRVGWIVANEKLIEKIVLAKQPMDLHTSTFSQYIALELGLSGFLPKHIQKLRVAYGARRDAMIAALTEFMPPNVCWTNPTGGMFLLVTLPPGTEASLLSADAVREKVLIVPGADFHVCGGENTFRLNFSNADSHKIRTGISRLSQTVRAAVQNVAAKRDRTFQVHEEPSQRG